MPGWGWFLIGFVVALSAAIVVFILLRKRDGVTVDKNALDASYKRRLMEELDAANESRKRTQGIAIELERELRGIADRKKRRMEAIDEESSKELRDLTDDPDALLSRIDEIVGGSEEAITQTGKTNIGG